jgi:hypothetical protein
VNFSSFIGMFQLLAFKLLRFSAALRGAVSLFILVLIIGHGTIGFAQTVPSTLFHWISARGLERWSNYIQEKREFRLKPMMQSIFITAYPGFKDKEGVFAWTDVVGGTGAFSSSADEWYAMTDKSTKAPARLVAIFLKPEVPLITLVTFIDRSSDIPKIISVDPRAKDSGTYLAGLVLHKIIDINTKEIFLQEYILMKRGFVNGIAADPSVTGVYLDQALQRLKDPTPYPDNDVHSVAENRTVGVNSPVKRKIIAKLLVNTKSLFDYDIPEYFRKNGTIPPAPAPEAEVIGSSCALIY